MNMANCFIAKSC